MVISISMKACGTEQVRSLLLEYSFPTFTLQPLGCRCISNHVNALPQMLNLYLRTCKMMLWSMVSKAANKSIAIKLVALPLSSDKRTSLTNFRSAVSQLYPCLYADW